MTRILITGPTGCIGSETVQYLFDQGVDEITGFSRTSDTHRLHPDSASRIRMIRGDISDPAQVDAAVRDCSPTHIIHLAAFQTPDCQAKPLSGMDINLGGTMNLFRSAATAAPDLQRVIFASSAAVYGPRDLYPGETVPSGAPFFPPNLYGFWKTGGEGVAQAFHLETGTPTVSLRLATTYGPGRDRGFTSAPTTAMKAAALGLSYRIPYEGREHFHYVRDVAAGFGQSALQPFEGYAPFNLRGLTVTSRSFCDKIRSIAAELGLGTDLDIAENAAPLPFVCDLDDSDLVQAFPEMPLTNLSSGIRESLEYFSEQVANKQLTPEDLG